MAYSFEKNEDVQRIIDRFKGVFESFFEIVTGEMPTHDKTIPEKVRKQIKDCGVFIGIITKKRSSEWGMPIWVIQENEIAKNHNKQVLILVEKNISSKDLGIQAMEREYISFDPNDISECVPKVLSYLNSMLWENNICFPYKFREVINRMTIYPDGRGIYDRTCTLEVTSPDFTKVVHGICLGDCTPKTTTLKPFDEIKTLKKFDRFEKEQALFWNVFETENLKPDNVVYKEEWKPEDIPGYNFSLIFGNRQIGTILKYAFGFSCKGLFPCNKNQLKNRELYGRWKGKLSDWLQTRSEVDKLVIIIQFDHDYELKGKPELVIKTQDEETVSHQYKFEKEDSLYYDTYKVSIGRTTPGFRYVVEWKPEIL